MKMTDLIKEMSQNISASVFALIYTYSDKEN